MSEFKNNRPLAQERFSWRCKMLKGEFEDPYILSEYRKHCGSELWRASRQVEQLCEYILHLERLLSGNKEHEVWLAQPFNTDLG